MHHLRQVALLILLTLPLTRQVHAQDASTEAAPAPRTSALAARSLAGPLVAVSTGFALVTLMAPATLMLGYVNGANPEDGDQPKIQPGVIGLAGAMALGGVILLIWGADRIHDIRAARKELERFKAVALMPTPGGAYLGARLRF